MGWEIGYDHTWDRDIGYGVPAECDHPDCKEQIDRGLAYICGGEPYGGELGCGLFFCAAHLFYAEKSPEYAQSPPSAEEMREWEEVHGDERGKFVCERCRDWHEEDFHIRLEFKTFDPKPDVEEWCYHKATDLSWAEWREQEGIPT
jgi:hypothetical protein